MQRFVRPLSSICLAILSICTTVPSVVLASDAVPSKISVSEVIGLVRVDLQRMVDRQKRVEGQGANVVISVSATANGRVLLVNLSSEYVPTHYGADFQDLIDQLSNRAYDIVRERSSLKEVRFLFAGKTLYELFPDEKPSRSSLTTQPSFAGTVSVAGGHGIYYHYKFKDWRAQREPYNGITEDFITPALVAELNTWLVARSGASLVNPRSTAVALHNPSGQPWWKLGARYNLEALLPDNPEIWHSRPTDTTALRERNEDINSRPLYANQMGAGTAINIHTNADDGSGTATGSRIQYYAGRAADQKLAENVACYMGELIHARTGYEEWRVPKTPDARNDLGELSKANMPSLIVEVGFHTNAGDAAAMQDPIFKTAAMKGVEKGYRLNGEGKDCVPFKIAKIPNVTGLQNVYIPVAVHYKGYPEFAVTATVEITSCPAGWSCNGGQVTYPTKADSPLKYNFICNTSASMPAATFGLRTTLKDIDEVKTKPVDHTVTCTPPANGQGYKLKPGQTPSLSISPA